MHSASHSTNICGRGGWGHSSRQDTLSPGPGLLPSGERQTIRRKGEEGRDMSGREGRALRPGGWRSGPVADTPGSGDTPRSWAGRWATLGLSDTHFAEKRPGPQNPRPENTLHSQVSRQKADKDFLPEDLGEETGAFTGVLAGHLPLLHSSITWTVCSAVPKRQMAAAVLLTGSSCGESVATPGGPAQAGQGAGRAQMPSPAFSFGDVRPALKGGS